MAFIPQTEQKKKKHNLKVKSYVSLSEHTKNLSPGGRLSDSSEGLFQRGKEGAKTYGSFFQKPENLVHQKTAVGVPVVVQHVKDLRSL